MIARLLIRLGLPLLVPFAGAIGLGALTTGGGLMSWLMGWTDWQTSGLLVVSLTTVALLATSQSPLARFAMALVIAACLYLKGRIDENYNSKAEMAEAVEIHKAEKMAIVRSYEIVVEGERKRQLEIKLQFEARLAQARLEYDSAKAEYKDKLGRLKKESANDPEGEFIALDADDVASLNKLRHKPRATPKPGVRGRKTKPARTSGVGKTPVPPAAGSARSTDEPNGGQGIMGLGYEAIRGMSDKAIGFIQGCSGAGCSVGWKGF